MPTVSWRLLDREAEIDVTHRQLPHWDQAGALTFVTFRLADSMPVSVLKLWDLEQQDWLARQGFPHLSIDDAFQTGALPEEIRRRFLKYRQSKWHDHLDMCLGSCVLSDPELATIVAGSLRQFDGERYDLERFVVMPNHVHLLVQMRAGFAIRTQCEGWLRYTARAINRVIGRRGEFWQSEPFDHVVRSEAQFEFLQKYIDENPIKAGLDPESYLLWGRK